VWHHFLQIDQRSANRMLHTEQFNRILTKGCVNTQNRQRLYQGLSNEETVTRR
jgi:hypothetical protein